MIVAGGIAGGVLATRGGGGDDDSSSSRSRPRKRSDSPAKTTSRVDEGGSGSLSRTDLGRAYEAIVGVTASSSTVDCLTKKVDDEDSALSDFLEGGTISASAAQRAFYPFLVCAPDEDFATAVRGIAPNADAACVSDTVQTLSIDDRTTVAVYAWVDQQGTITLIGQLFADCLY